MDTALTALMQSPDREKRARGLEYTPREIHGQVDLWADTVERIERRLPEIRSFLEPLSGKGSSTCILTGAGTSEFVGYCIEGLMRRRLRLPTDVFSTTKIVTNPEDLFVPGMHHLLMSFARSGNSPESVGAVRIADMLATRVSHMVVTCNRDGKLMDEIAGRERCLAIDLHPDTNDRGLAMTSSFSNMVVAGQALAHIFEPETFTGHVEGILACGRRVLDTAPDVVERLCRLDFDRAVFLGSGPNFGTAVESHLKLQELTAGAVMCAYDTFPGLRHGPEAVVHRGTLVVAFISRDPYVRRYETDLLAELKEKGLGRALMVCCDRAGEPLSGFADFTVEYDPGLRHAFPDDLAPPVQVIAGQLLGLFKSVQLGFRPDAPSETGVIHRVVRGVKVYDPVAYRKRGAFDIIAQG
jgi:tagatose-6-phosphate ketose/aldose isomerase